MTQQPNVLVIFADQLRGQDLGCAGNLDVQTPTIDRLAAEGVTCARTFANSPVCTPSRGTLLTGNYPLTHRAVVNDLPLPPGSSTVATVASEAGYRTGYIGKWHLDGVPRSGFTPPGPRRQGFSFWGGYNCSHEYYRKDKYYRDDPAPVMIDGYEPAVQTDLAEEFLSADDTRPFMLFLSWGPPHDPYDQVPDSFRTLYDPQDLELRANVQEIDPTVNRLANGLDPRQTTANYYAAISALDAQLNRLLTCLDKNGLSDNTIVIFTSDHGDMLFSHGLLKKELPWEESVRIPFIIRWPGHLPAGSRRHGLFSMVDVAPTVLDLLGLKSLLATDGVDRSDFLRGKGPGADSVLLMNILPATEATIQGFDEWRGIRTERYTYVESPGRDPWLLYDNWGDPWQLHNRIDAHDFLSTQAELCTVLRRRLREIGDAFHSGPEHLREQGLIELWNNRELDRNPENPQLLA